MANKRKKKAPLPSAVSGIGVILYFSQLAQAAVMGATRASGSGGGPWADPPSDTSGGTLSHDIGLPSGPFHDACGPSSSVPLLSSFSILLARGSRGAVGYENGLCHPSEG